MSAIILNIKLNNGIEMPVLGLDTCPDVIPDESKLRQKIEDAIDIGYRLFNCANNPSTEKAMGRAIQEKVRQKIIKREDLFIICKSGRCERQPGLVEVELLEKLQRLELLYVDLFLIDCQKNDANCRNDYGEIWKTLERLYKKNLVRALGVADGNNEQIRSILNVATVIPQVSQIRCHPFLNQREYRLFCEKQGVRVCSVVSFGNGRINANGNILEDNRVREVALRYGKTTAQILLKYNLQLDNITLFRLSEKSQMLKNMKIFDFYLAPEDISNISSFNFNL